uniref:Uncharacterized protein n=1 Tax=Saimiri boliviensis boliviensis TaxID=39432 RepID=A0A2K6UJ03_SAIBB
MEKQKKTRKCATMKQMLSLRDQRLKEKDRLKPKKKGKKDPSTLKEKFPNTLPAYFSSVIHSWVHLTTSSLIPTLSTFP